MLLGLLLERAGFRALAAGESAAPRIRETREGFAELRGRGAWHQIDCPRVYGELLPFGGPTYLLGAVRFYTTPVDKTHVRAFLGALRDIEEGDFSAGGQSGAPRRERPVGAFFSASGFTREAERLAYAQGIRTLSYESNYLVERIKDAILALEEVLSAECMRERRWKPFCHALKEYLRADAAAKSGSGCDPALLGEGAEEALARLREAFAGVGESLIASTATGAFLHLTGERPFPAELFRREGGAQCEMFYRFAPEHPDKRYFALQVCGDPERRAFYFAPPAALGAEELFGDSAASARELALALRDREVLRLIHLHLKDGWIGAGCEQYRA